MRSGTSPRSRRATTVARLPPALSPAIASRSGSAPSPAALAASKRTAQIASSSPAGNGASGASRYPTLTTIAPAALASARTTVSNDSIEPSIQPPPCR